MRVLLTTAASVFFVNFCECCNSPRCWLKISYSRALKPSIHAVLLLFRRGSGSLANVKCHDRCKVSSSSFSVSLCLTCMESPVHAISTASVVASKCFVLLRPLRFTPDSSYQEVSRPPLHDATTIAELEDCPWPDARDFD